MLQQIIRTINIQQTPEGHYNVDSSPSITKISGILPSPLVTAYDSEDNHLLI